jgi:hypothetical protein
VTPEGVLEMMMDMSQDMFNGAECCISDLMFDDEMLMRDEIQWDIIGDDKVSPSQF